MTSEEKQTVADFFHQISPKVLKLASEKFKKSEIVNIKGKDENTLNFATEADIAVENLIVEEIKKKFPKDKIIAEENYSDTKADNTSRFWIIDPICGTSNFAKEIKLFVTNIALADNGQLIASCAIDHAQEDYIWSVGDNKIFLNDQETTTDRKSSGISIEVDLGGAMTGSKDRKKQFSKFLSKLIQETNYAPLTYNSSLGFAYASIGRIDGYVCADVKVWDIAAANFLMLAVGGIITNIDGSPWTLNSREVVAARDKGIHGQLIRFLND